MFTSRIIHRYTSLNNRFQSLCYSWEIPLFNGFIWGPKSQGLTGGLHASKNFQWNWFVWYFHSIVRHKNQKSSLIIWMKSNFKSVYQQFRSGFSWIPTTQVKLALSKIDFIQIMSEDFCVLCLMRFGSRNIIFYKEIVNWFFKWNTWHIQYQSYIVYF